jgi:hypothetical protein
MTALLLWNFDAGSTSAEVNASMIPEAVPV